MKLVIQKVSSASVSVNNELVSSIGRGLCVLVGIGRNDSSSDVQFLTKKLLSLKLFEDENGSHWKFNVKDQKFELLCISQFTLHAVTNKGAKPDFHNSMKGEDSKVLYEDFLALLRSNYEEGKIKCGVFGAMMSVNIVNDGPVTILLESPSEKEASTTTAAFNSSPQAATKTAASEKTTSINKENTTTTDFRRDNVQHANDS